MKKLLLILLVLATPIWAVEPDEILSDPVMEARAREISKVLRCVVCRNENIDTSKADVARDLRLLVRERLVAGDNDDQVLEFIVDRYGEYILLMPPFNKSNAILWASGPFALIIGLGVGLYFIRRRPKVVAAGLSDDEESRLQELMGK